MLDVAIIGGGPAGAAAALALLQIVPEAAVVLFDAGRGGRWKPGETLSPGAMTLLESLGCRDVVASTLECDAALESYGTQAAWGDGELYQREFLFSLHGNGWRLDRARFDDLLLKHAEAAGVEVQRRCALLDSVEGEDCWRLEFAVGGDRKSSGAQFVIDATGREARFATQRGARPRVIDRLAGVFMLFDTTDIVSQGARKREMETLVEAQACGWWYSTAIPGNRAVVAWMSDTDLIREMGLKSEERWHDLLAQSEHTGRRLEGAVARGTPMIFTAQSQILDRMGGCGWVASGDAAMTFDPLSSQGIVKALWSGRLASFVAADYLLRGVETQDRYARMARAEFEAYVEARRAYYREEQRWPESRFWARRHEEPVKR